MKEGKYILLKDFNLYYPLCYSVRNPIYYIKDDKFAGLIRYAGLEFTLS
jgi:hypothetical protein